MSVLSDIYEQDDWVTIQPPKEEDDKHTVGYYNGEPVRVGFEKDTERTGENYKIYRSGVYVVDVKLNDDTREAMVSRGNIEDARATTKLIQSYRGYYELTIPSRFARHQNLDEIVETETTTRKEDGKEKEIEIERGKHVALEVEEPGTDERGLNLIIREATEDDKIPQKTEDGDVVDTYPPHIRRIQRKPIPGDEEEYTQHYIYFPSTLVAAHGLEDESVEWRIADDKIIGNVRAPSEIELENAEITDPNYTDTLKLAPENAVRSIRADPPFQQTRIILSQAQSKALGFLVKKDSSGTAYRLSDALQNREEQVAYLIESGKHGFTYIIHTDPDGLPQTRTSKSTVSQVNVNNPSAGAEYATQIVANYPKDVAFSHHLVNDPILWWPVQDEFYGTDEPMLVGRRVSALLEHDLSGLKAVVDDLTEQEAESIRSELTRILENTNVGRIQPPN